MIKALDLLGLADNDWKRKETALAVPAGFGGGSFVDTFSDIPGGINAVKEWLSVRKAHGLSTPVWRFQFWRSHALTEIPALKAALPRIKALKAQFPETEFYVSHSCEYLSGNVLEIKKRCDLIRSFGLIPVNTPMRSPTVPGVITEVHGKTVAKPGQFVSYDGGVHGEALYDIDAQGWISANRNAAIVFAWCPRFNLTESIKEGQKNPPPKDRTAAPSGKFLRGVCQLFEDPGTPPIPAFAAKPFIQPQLLKAWAEDMQGENSRDNLPMIFVREKSAKAELLTFTGQAFTYFPLYQDRVPHSLERYYSGLGPRLYAWEIAEKARILSGHPWYWLRVGKSIYGPFTWFRTPFYQA